MPCWYLEAPFIEFFIGSNDLTQLVLGVDRDSALEDQVTSGQLSGADKLSSSLNVWVTYEKRVKEAPTWPFNAAIVSRLLLSALMPAAIYLIKIIGSFWARFGF